MDWFSSFIKHKICPLGWSRQKNVRPSSSISMGNISRLHLEFKVSFLEVFFVLFLNLRLSRLSLFIQHQDNSLIKTVLENWVLSPVWKTSGSAPSEPLLCKFADGGQKKRQSQGKYLQNGRPWTRDGETVSFVFFLVYFFMPVRGGSKHLMFLPHNDIALLFSSSREEWPSPMTQPQPYRMGQYAGSY